MKYLNEDIKTYRLSHSLRYYDLYLTNGSNKIASVKISLKVGRVSRSTFFLSKKYLHSYRFVDLSDVYDFSINNHGFLNLSRKIMDIFPGERIKICRLYFISDKNTKLYFKMSVLLENGFTKDFSELKNIYTVERKFDPIEYVLF